MIKRHLAWLDKSYAVSCLRVNGRETAVFAPDDIGACLCVDLETGACEKVWDKPGGTMSIIPLHDGMFLASQCFFPDFTAREAQIVRALRTDEGWRTKLWMKLPYVHRFDVVQSGGKRWFLGCILSGANKPKADFAVAGSLVAGRLGAGDEPPEALETIADGMHRNHGYCRQCIDGEDVILTSCDEGVFRVLPPTDAQSGWLVRKILDVPASDVAMCDLDGDGKQELVCISPFHGDELCVFHEEDGGYRRVYEVPHRSAFLHAIWAGNLRGRNVALVGGRAQQKELLEISYGETGYQTRVIEKGYGASNLFVCNEGVLIANREAGECACFEFE